MLIYNMLFCFCIFVIIYALAKQFRIFILTKCLNKTKRLLKAYLTIQVFYNKICFLHRENGKYCKKTLKKFEEIDNECIIDIDAFTDEIQIRDLLEEVHKYAEDFSHLSKKEVLSTDIEKTLKEKFEVYLPTMNKIAARINYNEKEALKDDKDYKTLQMLKNLSI